MFIVKLPPINRKRKETERRTFNCVVMAEGAILSKITPMSIFCCTFSWQSPVEIEVKYQTNSIFIVPAKKRSNLPRLSLPLQLQSFGMILVPQEGVLQTVHILNLGTRQPGYDKIPRPQNDIPFFSRLIGISSNFECVTRGYQFNGTS